MRTEDGPQAARPEAPHQREAHELQALRQDLPGQVGGWGKPRLFGSGERGERKGVKGCSAFDKLIVGLLTFFRCTTFLETL
jgi:hypothetical protein